MDRLSLYHSEEMSKHGEFLSHMLQYSELSIVVLGPEGSGKTVFTRWLKRSFPQQSEWQSLNASELGNIEIFVQYLCLHLHVSPPSSSQTYEAWALKICSVDTPANIPVYFAIDNAESLSLEILTLILTLLSVQIESGVSLVRFILTGRSTVEVNLRRIKDFSRHSSHLHFVRLKGLVRDELPSYISFYLENKGKTVSLDTDVDTLNLLYSNTSGTYTRLNSAIEQLVQGYKGTRSKTKKNINYLYIVLVIVVIFVGLLFVEIPNESMENNLKLRKELAERINRNPNSIEQPIEDNKAIEQRTDELVGNIEQHGLPLQNVGNTTTPDVVGVSEPVIELPAKDEDKLNNYVEPTSAPAEVKIEAKQELSDNKAIPLISIDADDSVANTPSKTNGDKRTAKSETNAISEREKLNEKNHSTDEVYLLSLDGSMYTNQVIAMASLEAADSYINEHPFKQRAYVYRRRVKNKVYFAVVVGIYSDQKIALNAAKNELLPIIHTPTLLKKISDVQRAINDL